MEATVELLLEKGYEGTTMQDIADRAEFAVGTLYRFFKGKKELVEELILEGWRNVQTRLTQALESTENELECLRAYNRLSAELTLEYQALAHIYFGNLFRYNLVLVAGVEGEVRTIVEGFITHLERLFRSGIEKGIFVDLNPRILALGYDTLVGSYMTVAYGKEKPVDLETWIDTIDRMFFESVLIKNK